MADAPNSQKPQEKPESQRGPTRIPITKVAFSEPEDLPGGNSLAYEIDCSPQKVPGRQFFVGHFIPAWQIIELEWYRNETAEPKRFRYPVARVKRFD